MEKEEIYSFQVDSEMVKEVYRNNDNYLIEYSAGTPPKYCVIYFSSNDLYYPNTETAFQERIVIKDHFEWYKTRIQLGHKHIFVRDVQKQFYLAGINCKLNNSQKFLSFLKEETIGYKVITVGSSAGGFASVTYGQLLNAERIYSFNGSFEIRSKLNVSTEIRNPIIFRNKGNKDFELWLDTRNFISNPSTIYYFQSIKSAFDLKQYAHVQDIPINRIQFLNSKHGIPFLKSNLPKVFSCTPVDLKQMTIRRIHPIIFSVKMVGVLKTSFALTSVIRYKLRKLNGFKVLRA